MFVLPIARTFRTSAANPGVGRTLDRLFDESRVRLAADSSAAAAVTPALDVSESDTHYQVVLDLPGATRDQLKVTVEGRRVSVETIAATATEASPAAVDATPAQPAARVLYRERGVARFARTVSLPAEVDSASAQARLENGVLTLSLAKKVATGAVRISIN